MAVFQYSDNFLVFMAAKLKLLLLQILPISRKTYVDNRELSVLKKLTSLSSVCSPKLIYMSIMIDKDMMGGSKDKR